MGKCNQLWQDELQEAQELNEKLLEALVAYREEAGSFAINDQILSQVDEAISKARRK